MFNSGLSTHNYCIRNWRYPKFFYLVLYMCVHMCAVQLGPDIPENLTEIIPEN